MMKILRAMMCLSFVAFLVFACSSAPTQVASPPAPLSLHLEDKTVSIYSLEGDAPRCTGVWVAPYRILTAAHCKSVDVENPVFYSVAGEYAGYYNKPKQEHPIELILADEGADLALYRTGALDTPSHAIAILAKYTPAVGDGLNFMGHPKGFAWTYRRGWVSFMGDMDGDDAGHWMQVSAPIFPGDSGGGAFDDQGSLTGIVLQVTGVISNTAFCSPVATLRKFLEQT